MTVAPDSAPDQPNAADPSPARSVATCDRCERPAVVLYHVAADGVLIDGAACCWAHRPGVDLWGQEEE